MLARPSFMGWQCARMMYVPAVAMGCVSPAGHPENPVPAGCDGGEDLSVARREGGR
ncbi:hypothetical protein FRAAL2556 [Frankia alni ACN14a]|uniref:Lipoprotein n=1 Tax=Frankia alni (strain DSM 45986 / CECT 9034 / ACN14a) TaxID=326424 RepID=Q0RMP4_FRAAA|nr:hypothetical protein FRAAL2556 [Frankia alni ACN14a]